MIAYAEAKKRVFAHGTRPDGYCGDRIRVGFALLGKQIYTIAPCGYFRAGLPDCIDEVEARWLLVHHPSARHITLTS